MRIGLLPPMETVGAPSVGSAGALESRPRTAAVTRLRHPLTETDAVQPVNYGGGYVDFDHQ